jgi:D-amino-acid dehydrogenase
MAGVNRGAYDAVVIGGGIIGVCTALNLRRTGRSVALFERGRPGDRASGHNGGIFSGDCVPTGMPGVMGSLPKLLTDPESPLVLRPRYIPGLAPWLVRFALNSTRSRVERIAPALRALTARFDAYVPLVTGTAAEEILANRGCMAAYIDSASLDPEALPFQLRRRTGHVFEILDRDGVGARSPALAGRFEAAVWYPNAHFTHDPGALTRTLLDRFVAEGGASIAAEVTHLETDGPRVRRVRMRDGDVTAVDAVVIAAGPWSRSLLRQLGTDVPLDAERGYGADLPQPGVRLDVPVIIQDFHVGISPYRGGLRIAGTDELASVDAPADLRIPERLIRQVRSVFPELRTDGAELWMAARPSMPDSLPVIGRAPRVENAYLAFGHGHKGLGTGAITGKLVQEIMDGAPTTIDVTPYSATRFSLARAFGVGRAEATA